LATYDALARVGRNPAIVESRGAYCGGCNLRLPERLVGQIRGEKNLFTCPHCHRFLYVKLGLESERRIDEERAKLRPDEGED
jgi:predicted  nucleic acid-binding Zn-ribbon protein